MKLNFEEIDEARKTLDLDETATMGDIKRNFRRLSKKWHPDKCKKEKQKECHEMMKNINKAYKLIMAYCEHYKYSFTEKKVIGESPEEFWKKRFGKDPLWGPGWE